MKIAKILQGRVFIIYTFCMIAVLPVYSQNFDINTLRDINLDRNQSLDQSMIFTSHSVYPLVIGVPMATLAHGYWKKDSIAIKNAYKMMAGSFSTLVINTSIKFLTKRQRPYITYPDLENLTTESSFSFPSGHTSNAFALATSLTFSYKKWYVYVPAYTWAVTVGYSRMHLGVHYPSDVLGGAIVGTGSVLLSNYLSKKLFAY